MTTTPPAPRDHGGNLDAAIRAHGGPRADWIDLSTGINPVAYPVPDIPLHVWGTLPTATDIAALEHAAADAYRARTGVVALSGAQGAIQLVPRLGTGSDARVLGPTYNEHAAALRSQGWDVRTVTDMGALQGADLAVVVNPNNPGGQSHTPPDLAALAGQTGLLVVDESFGDAVPNLSFAPMLGDFDNVLVLRSFGKFYGLAGVRLGFALGPDRLIERMRILAGPWAVNGPAIAIATKALADTGWQAETIARLARDAQRLDRLAATAGWSLVGGTTLFRTYETPNAAAAQSHLACHRIWSRVFPYAPGWIRLGLAGPEPDWQRLEMAMAELP